MTVKRATTSALEQMVTAIVVASKDSCQSAGFGRDSYPFLLMSRPQGILVLPWRHLRGVSLHLKSWCSIGIVKVKSNFVPVLR